MSEQAREESNRLEDCDTKGEVRQKFTSFWECKMHHIRLGDKWFIWSGKFILLGE